MLTFATESARRMFGVHLRRRWYVYVIGAIAVIVTNITEVLVPKCVQWSIDLAYGNSVPTLFQQESPQHTFLYIFYVLVLVFVVQALSRRYWRLTLGIETTNVGSALRSTLWRRAQLFPESVLQQEYSVGALMNISTSDINSGRAVFGWTLVGLTDLVFLSLFCFVAMFTIDWRLSLMVIVFFPGLAFILRRIQLQEYRAHAAAQETLSQLNETCSQAVATIKLQRITSTAEYWFDRLCSAAMLYRDRRFAVVVTALRFLLVMGIFPLLAYAVVFIFGWQLVVSGGLTLGAFIAFQSYVFILQGPLAEMGYVLADWQRSMASLNRVLAALNVVPEPSLVEAPHQRPVPLEWPVDAQILELRDVVMQYPGTQRRVIEKVSFSLRRFEKLGIMGPIGSGKSTLLRIVGGLEPRFQGSVKLLGHDIREYTHSSLRREVSFIPQKPFLFADTIRSNMTLGRNCSDDQIWYYLEICQIADEVNNLPGKLDAQLGEWGINLSGGQKQRLTLARGLISRPKLVLLDDCLSAVDAITEEKLLRGLEDEIGDLTVVWVAHRRSTLRLASRIIEL